MPWIQASSRDIENPCAWYRSLQRWLGASSMAFRAACKTPWSWVINSFKVNAGFDLNSSERFLVSSTPLKFTTIYWLRLPHRCCSCTPIQGMWSLSGSQSHWGSVLLAAIWIKWLKASSLPWSDDFMFGSNKFIMFYNETSVAHSKSPFIFVNLEKVFWDWEWKSGLKSF